jgi:hypothetical protein
MGTGLAGGMRFVCMNDSCFTKPFERWRMACGMRCVRRYASCEDNCSQIHRDSESSKFTGSSARQGIFRICGHCRLRARSLNLRLVLFRNMGFDLR